MPKQPHNEHELELALTRYAGSNIAAVECRDIMAGVILGQMLPTGSVVKGGTSMRLRLGPERSRVTVDFDTARSIDLDAYIKDLRTRLEAGWCDFTGEVLIRKQGSPSGVPFEYIMQPLDVKLAYRHHPWCTVRLEVGHNELGDADESETRELPQKILGIFDALNLPKPKPIPLMPIPFQIAQKLHGVSQPGSSRVRDLIDIQLIAQNETVDFARTANICRRLFAYRKTHGWPPQIEKGNLWSEIYSNQKGALPVLPTVDEAIAWTNDLIDKIDKAQLYGISTVTLKTQTGTVPTQQPTPTGTVPIHPPRIFNVFDKTLKRFDVLATGHILSVSGFDMPVDAAKADEGAWLERRTHDGYVQVAKGRIVSSAPDILELVFDDPIPTGKYMLAVYTRCGNDDKYRVVRISRKIRAV